MDVVVVKQQSIGAVIRLVVPWYGPEVEDSRMVKELRARLSRDPRIVVMQQSIGLMVLWVIVSA